MRLVKIFTSWIAECVIITIIVIILFAIAFGCSDETTITSTEIVEHHDHQHGNKYRPYQSKSCQVVIDSLEAELEECRE